MEEASQHSILMTIITMLRYSWKASALRWLRISPIISLKRRKTRRRERSRNYSMIWSSHPRVTCRSLISLRSTGKILWAYKIRLSTSSDSWGLLWRPPMLHPFSLETCSLKEVETLAWLWLQKGVVMDRLLGSRGFMIPWNKKCSLNQCRSKGWSKCTEKR